jgi:predicted DNA-binding protein
MSEKSTRDRRTRGEHCLNVFVSFELKQQLKELAEKYDRTTADIIRAVLRVGIPLLDGLSRAEEIMVKEYVQLFRRLRKVRSLKDI